MKWCPVSEAVEITSFKLVRGLMVDDFIALNEDIDVWLNQQPGFRSRRIAAMPDGTIVDMLIWDSVAQGTDAAERIMTEMKDSPVHSAIVQDTVVWRIATVRRFTKAAG